MATLHKQKLKDFIDKIDLVSIYPAVLIKRFGKDDGISHVSRDLHSIWNLKIHLSTTILTILTLCRHFVSGMENYFQCYQRSQGLHVVGIDVSKSTMCTSDIQKLPKEIQEIQKFIQEMKLEILQDVAKAYEAVLNICRPWIDLNSLCYEQLAETKFQEYEMEFIKLAHSLHKKFSLVVTVQPEPVIQTKKERVNSVHVTFLNINNNLPQNIRLQIYLIGEPVVKQINENGKLPQQLKLAGTLMLAGKGNAIEDYSKLPNKRKRKYSTKKQKYSKILPYGINAGSQESVDNCTGLEIQFNSSTPNKLYLNMPVAIKITEVVRNGKRKVKAGEKESSENVANEKYCFLFVVELLVEGQTEKAWTTSLPFIVTTHGSHNERAWATMVWENAFPLPGRKGFEVQKSAHTSQILEVLEGYFNKRMKKPLTPSHLKCIENKLNQHVGKDAPKILWTELIQEREINGEKIPSFWRWFYRSGLIVMKGPFKDEWDNGLFEGFISFEDACTALFNAVDTTNGQSSPVGTFLIRFSDSEPGSISMVYITVTVEGKIGASRMKPIEFYLRKSLAESSTLFLHQLNSKYESGREVLCRLYPDKGKRDAFAKFYKHAPDNNQTKSKEHYVGLSFVADTSKPNKVVEKTENNTHDGTSAALPTDSSNASGVANEVTAFEPSAVELDDDLMRNITDETWEWLMDHWKNLDWPAL
ncbi:Signal transducer and activator of transcription 5B [Orchesella cincta]|uniref:Signal transducer and activator of transcription 5B n=1 Tax=Orchesella cincta TaxID=48709 RepID=A0A1D2M5N3_ORCCI|nr:Signal transducer and activator of transcription 5B [Orchesella cincta]